MRYIMKAICKISDNDEINGDGENRKLTSNTNVNPPQIIVMILLSLADVIKNDKIAKTSKY